MLAACFTVSVVAAQDSGSGVLEPTEEYDDFNIDSGDGCSDNCTVELPYICNNATNMTSGSTYSICQMALLDLDTTDGTTLNFSLEFKDLNQIIFLSGIDMTEFVTPLGVSCH